MHGMWADEHYLAFRSRLLAELGTALPAPYREQDALAPLRLALQRAGKLLRPYLALLAFQCVGGRGEGIWPVAAGIEIGHVASLVHDDIMDQSALRRGLPSVASRFGLNGALLAGDMLVFLSFLQVCRGRSCGLTDQQVSWCVEALAQAEHGLRRRQLIDEQQAHVAGVPPLPARRRAVEQVMATEAAGSRGKVPAQHRHRRHPPRRFRLSALRQRANRHLPPCRPWLR
jgi:hypothetical protein